MNIKREFKAFLACLSANLGSFCVGSSLAWTSPIIPDLRTMTQYSPLRTEVTYNEEGWISSMLAVGATIGSPLAGPLANTIGRKWTLLISALVYTVSYSTFFNTISIWHLYLGRLLQGIATGFVFTVIPMYNSEIATDETRGPFGSMIPFMRMAGVLYVYSMGAYVSFKNMQMFCMIVPVLFFGTFFFMPETPYFYAMKKRKYDLGKSLEFLRGRYGEDIADEIEQIQSTVDDEMSQKGTLPEIIKNPKYRKAFLMSSGLLIFQELCGNMIITINCRSIFISADSLPNPTISAIIMTATQIIVCFINPFLVNRVGRKKLLTISGSGMAVTLLALGTYFYIHEHVDVTILLWSPIIIIVLYKVVYTIGFAHVPWIMLGEILPTHIRGTVASFVVTLNCIITFFMVRLFPNLSVIGFYYPFWLCGVVNVLSCIFIRSYVIETKGLSLQEIQRKLIES